MAPELPKYLFTVMCDDIRPEVNNKLSLMGIYSDQIYFSSTPPFHVRSLAFYNRFSKGKGTFTLKFRITDPDGEHLVETQQDKTIFPVAQDSEFSTVSVVLGGLELKKEGPYRFEICVDDDSNQIAIYNFKVATNPAKFTQSASQLSRSS